MCKKIIFSFVISAGLFFSASITANAETTAVNKSITKTETTTSTESISNKVNYEENKNNTKNPVENSSKQNNNKGISNTDEKSDPSSTNKDSSIKNNSNKSTTESTLTINVIKETATPDNSRNDNTIYFENAKNETTDKINITALNEKTSSEALAPTENNENPSKNNNNSASLSEDNKVPSSNSSLNKDTIKQPNNETLNKDYKSNPVIPDTPKIPDIPESSNINLPDTALIDYGDGTTTRIPINWLFINNSNVASLNILGNNYLFDYSINDSFNEVNVVNTIVVTVTNFTNSQFITTDGLPAFNTNITGNNRIIRNNSSPENNTLFKPQSLNQNKISTVPKTYDCSGIYLTIALLILSCSSLLLFKFKKAV